MRWAALVVFILLASGAAHAQMMAPTLSCDVYVNKMRITWPPGYMGAKECNQLAWRLEQVKKEGTTVECKCQKHNWIRYD